MNYCFSLYISIVVSSSMAAIHVNEKRWQPPEELSRVLDAHSDEISKAIDGMRFPRKKYRDGVWTFSWLPGYYVKYDLKRISGLKKIRSCIKRHNLTLISVTDKYIYHIKGRPLKESNSNYVVIAKAVETPNYSPPMTREHVKQLETLIENTYFTDLTGTNYVQQADGTLCFIDTEGIFDRSRKLKAYIKLICAYHDLNTDYTQEALTYLFEIIKKYLERDSYYAPLVFNRLKRAFSKQSMPHAWNYEEQCYTLLKNVTPSPDEIEDAVLD